MPTPQRAAAPPPRRRRPLASFAPPTTCGAAAHSRHAPARLARPPRPTRAATAPPLPPPPPRSDAPPPPRASVPPPTCGGLRAQPAHPCAPPCRLLRAPTRRCLRRVANALSHPASPHRLALTTAQSLHLSCRAATSSVCEVFPRHSLPRAITSSPTEGRGAAALWEEDGGRAEDGPHRRERSRPAAGSPAWGGGRRSLGGGRAAPVASGGAAPAGKGRVEEEEGPHCLRSLSVAVDFMEASAIVWTTDEAKAAQNWRKQYGKKLAKRLGTCGLESRMQVKIFTFPFSTT
ncbi:hypothetical protein U9M48_027631 [Paspalum notatum var. saurae]|uniref:Uncharacterized protein n=1 Tax=Paspalum notatum var. saurae TaxID=547442 RepID=A0AAQ3TUS5_PASNO